MRLVFDVQFLHHYNGKMSERLRLTILFVLDVSCLLHPYFLQQIVGQVVAQIPSR